MRPLLQDLVELGRMTEEEALHDPRANQLRSVIYGDAIPLIDMNADGFGLEQGDLVVLASDGLETLPDEALAEVIMAGASDAEGVVQALLDAVAGAGRPGQDNTTVLVYRVGDGLIRCTGRCPGPMTQARNQTPCRRARLPVTGRSRQARRGNPRVLSRGYWVCCRGAAGRNEP